jgi:alkyl hydroperoxide reductase subunit AhpF
MLSERDRREVAEQLRGLTDRVRLVCFTQELACQHCRETELLLKEVAGLSGSIELAIHNLQIEKDVTARYRVDKVPATVVEGAKDYGIRFYGIPAGYEFATLLDVMRDVSRGSADLGPEARASLATLATPIHLQVFVTPT